ncbi:hypothetical protein MPSEU_000019000 [Mayamaea pseudoterrestris]|nr:hypothetical protein MPSEU_000019000 [Mayamaea pseudoterrestris]
MMSMSRSIRCSHAFLTAVRSYRSVSMRVNTFSKERRSKCHAYIQLSASSSDSNLMRSFSVDETTFYAGHTVSQALQLSHNLLQENDIDEPDLSVTNILAACLNLPWESGFRDLQSILQSTSSTSSLLASRTLTAAEAQHFAHLLQRRLQHEPIQYLVGQWDFYKHTFYIQPPLLCPRPETEQLVELAVADITEFRRKGASRCDNDHAPIRILDIGAGTGCLGISIAAALLENDLTVHALDIEPIAVRTSKRNAERVLGPAWSETYSVALVSANDYQLDADGSMYDFIVSNPPYIPQADYNDLHPTVKRYESADALVAGEDGMKVIRDIIERLPLWAKPGAFCWMEVDPSQPKLIRSICDEKVEYVETIRDIFGRDRFVKLRVK